MMNFENSELICRMKNPLDWTKENTKVMVEACREMAEFHYSHSKEIKFIYDKAGFDPSSLKTEEDLKRIPSIGVTAMKYHLLLSLPEEKAVLKLTSSGTSGQKTQVWFDQESLNRVQSQLDVLWDQEGKLSNEKTNYLLFIYDPEQAKDLGIAFSVKNEMRFAPENKSYFSVKLQENGEWKLDFEKTYEVLCQYEKEGIPVRILGIPGFIFEFLNYLETNNKSFKLHSKSFMITGGGWKASEDKKVTRADFRNLCQLRFGIPTDNMRDGYGMAEHSAPYTECHHHQFHVPIYNRVFVRDPVTMETLPDGTEGLLELVTPFNAMMPTLSILTTDLGYINVEKCPCGRNSPTFSLIGRGGLKKHKGCAISAGEIVKRG